MPIQAPLWTDFLCCPICCNVFAAQHRAPISLGCGHTICRQCLATLHSRQCPFDQTPLASDVSALPVNNALLQLVGNGADPSGGVVTPADDYVRGLAVVDSTAASGCGKAVVDFQCYLTATKCIEQLAGHLKPLTAQPAATITAQGATAAATGLISATTALAGGAGGNNNLTGCALSRPMQRKLVTLLNCQLMLEEGRVRALRAARLLGERCVTELILHHQNPQLVSINLWSAVRSRGCQYLGPAMQEEVLKLVLRALQDGTAMSRKVLVMCVVELLEARFPQASKTSIGHVVQLLYRASCFKVAKREADSSLMQLKEEFRTYEALRREHDAQIVQIATEAGLRIAPDQWSALLYGDTAHKSHMQSIVDTLQTPSSFAQSVQELIMALQRTGDPSRLASLHPQFKHLASIDLTPEAGGGGTGAATATNTGDGSIGENAIATAGQSPTWPEVARALEAVLQVVQGLVGFLQQHGGGGGGGSNGRKGTDGAAGSLNGGGSAGNGGSGGSRYKQSLCRDLAVRRTCRRGPACTFAHNTNELDRYRNKSNTSHLNEESANVGGKVTTPAASRTEFIVEHHAAVHAGDRGNALARSSISGATSPHYGAPNAHLGHQQQQQHQQQGHHSGPPGLLHLVPPPLPGGNDLHSATSPISMAAAAAGALPSARQFGDMIVGHGRQSGSHAFGLSGAMQQPLPFRPAGGQPQHPAARSLPLQQQYTQHQQQQQHQHHQRQQQQPQQPQQHQYRFDPKLYAPKPPSFGLRPPPPLGAEPIGSNSSNGGALSPTTGHNYPPQLPIGHRHQPQIGGHINAMKHSNQALRPIRGRSRDQPLTAQHPSFSYFDGVHGADTAWVNVYNDGGSGHNNNNHNNSNTNHTNNGPLIRNTHNGSNNNDAASQALGLWEQIQQRQQHQQQQQQQQCQQYLQQQQKQKQFQQLLYSMNGNRDISRMDMELPHLQPLGQNEEKSVLSPLHGDAFYSSLSRDEPPINADAVAAYANDAVCDISSVLGGLELGTAASLNGRGPSSASFFSNGVTMNYQSQYQVPHRNGNGNGHSNDNNNNLSNSSSNFLSNNDDHNYLMAGHMGGGEFNLTPHSLWGNMGEIRQTSLAPGTGIGVDLMFHERADNFVRSDSILDDEGATIDLPTPNVDASSEPPFTENKYGPIRPIRRTAHTNDSTTSENSNKNNNDNSNLDKNNEGIAVRAGEDLTGLVFEDESAIIGLPVYAVEQLIADTWDEGFISLLKDCNATSSAPCDHGIFGGPCITILQLTIVLRYPALVQINALRWFKLVSGMAAGDCFLASLQTFIDRRNWKNDTQMIVYVNAIIWATTLFLPVYEAAVKDHSLIRTQLAWIRGQLLKEFKVDLPDKDDSEINGSKREQSDNHSSAGVSACTTLEMLSFIGKVFGFADRLGKALQWFKSINKMSDDDCVIAVIRQIIADDKFTKWLGEHNLRAIYWIEVLVAVFSLHSTGAESLCSSHKCRGLDAGKADRPKLLYWSDNLTDADIDGDIKRTTVIQQNNDKNGSGSLGLDESGLDKAGTFFMSVASAPRTGSDTFKLPSIGVDLIQSASILEDEEPNIDTAFSNNLAKNKGSSINKNNRLSTGNTNCLGGLPNDEKSAGALSNAFISLLEDCSVSKSTLPCDHGEYGGPCITAGQLVMLIARHAARRSPPPKDELRCLKLVNGNGKGDNLINILRWFKLVNDDIANGECLIGAIKVITFDRMEPNLPQLLKDFHTLPYWWDLQFAIELPIRGNITQFRLDLHKRLVEQVTFIKCHIAAALTTGATENDLDELSANQESTDGVSGAECTTIPKLFINWEFAGPADLGRLALRWFKVMNKMRRSNDCVTAVVHRLVRDDGFTEWLTLNDDRALCWIAVIAILFYPHSSVSESYVKSQLQHKCPDRNSDKNSDQQETDDTKNSAKIQDHTRVKQSGATRTMEWSTYINFFELAERSIYEGRFADCPYTIAWCPRISDSCSSDTPMIPNHKEKKKRKKKRKNLQVSAVQDGRPPSPF